ncbi:MAG: LytTR family DNA-binding domain-containing protein [Clostridia bacterium]
MNIFVCDDEEKHINEVISILENFFKDKKITDVNFHIFTSGEMLLNSEIVPDLVFLDIELNAGINGTQVGKKLQDKYSGVKIFIVTSHIDYLDEAFRFSFFRYILKPIQKHAFLKNVEDALIQQKNEIRNVNFNTKDGTIVAKAMDIIAIKVEKRGTMIFLTDSTFFSTDNISSLEKTTLGMNFFRTHRDYIVNFRYVVKHDDYTVYLNYNNKIKIEAYLSRPKRTNFKKSFNWYMERVYDYL